MLPVPSRYLWALGLVVLVACDDSSPTTPTATETIDGSFGVESSTGFVLVLGNSEAFGYQPGGNPMDAGSYRTGFGRQLVDWINRGHLPGPA